MAPTKKTPTIMDVARRAKVSAATVSRVVSDTGRVSDTTRERVNAAIRETGYTLNQAARSLRMRAAKTILIALPDIGNPFYSTILEAVVDQAASRGYGVLVASRFGGDAMRMLNDYFLSSRADGMLLFDGRVEVEMMRALATPSGQLPLVVSFDEAPQSEVASVMVDNLSAAEHATEYLIGLGHRHIAHVTGPSRTPQPSLRLAGFRNAMSRAGLPIRPDWLLDGDYTMPTGADAARRLLAQGGPLPTAVFCANDEMAIGFLAAMRDHGIECPRDISLIGFDDIDVAAFHGPHLTTMRQPREAIGRLATEALIDILEGTNDADASRHVTLRAELVVRNSARALG